MRYSIIALSSNYDKIRKNNFISFVPLQDIIELKGYNSHFLRDEEKGRFNSR